MCVGLGKLVFFVLASVAFFVVHESLSMLSAFPYAWLLWHAVGLSWFSRRCGTVEFVIATLFIVHIILWTHLCCTYIVVFPL